MAGSRSADVNLIVRAKTEGEKAISSLADTLEGLLSGARDGTTDIAELGRTLAALDKAAATVVGSVDKAGAALDRQRNSIAENRDALAALVAQQEAAARVATSLQDQVAVQQRDVDLQYRAKVDPALVQRAAGAVAEQDRLTAQIDRTRDALQRQQSQVDGAQSSLLKLSITSDAIAEGQAEAAAQIELTNQALREQEQAAGRVTAIQQRINDLTGVNRPDARGSAAAVADILAAADAEYRRVEAARATAEAQQAVNNQLAERANLEAALERTTGVGKLRASDSGATFSALDQREREAEATRRAQDAEQALTDARQADAEAQRRQINLLAERANLEAALERTTGLGRQRAIDSGATISALTELVNKEHQAAEASEEMDQEVARLRATLDPLAAIQKRFNDELARYTALAKAGKLEADELAAAEAHLAAEADRARAALDDTGNTRGANGKISLFGLKPYELQNLSYQINDVITGLASGQRATQIIAQQGGQILQLFPQITGNIMGALQDPRLRAAVVLIAGLAAGIKKAADEAERLRDFTATTTFRADGGDYDPAKLYTSAQSLKEMGATAEDARAAVKALLSDGIDPAALDQFAAAAQNTAEALGTDLSTAAKQVADAFTGGYDAVAALDDKLNFLTASEREHIRQLFEEGNAQAARTEALNAYSRQAEAAAAKQRGPWSEAAKSLAQAWEAMLHWVATSAPIRAAIFVLNELADAVKGVGDAITSALGGAGPAASSQAANISRVQEQIRTLQADIARYEKAIKDGSPIAGTLQALVDNAKEQLRKEQGDLARLEKNAPDTINDDPNSAAAKERADDLRRISAEDELQRLRDAGQTRLLTAQERARRAELAGIAAARNATDAIVAAAEKRRAVAHETAAIEKESDARRKADLADRERRIKDYLGAIVGAEGGTGRNRAGSSAEGAGQFTRRTFIDLYRRANPDSALSDDQVADLRRNTKVATQLLEVFTRDNARVIERYGKQVNGANLYLLHFLGSGTGAAALRAAPNTPIDQIIRRTDPRNAATIFSQNAAYLRTEKGTGRFRTVAELQKELGSRVGDPGRAQSRIINEERDLLDDARQKQEAFNTAVRHGQEDRERSIESLKAEAGLYGTALLAEQRRQAVLEAELNLRQKIEDANKNKADGAPAVVVTAEQLDRERELAATLFDQQHARDAIAARLQDAERPLNNLQEQRDLLAQQAEFLRSIGDSDSAAAVDEQLRALGGSIGEAYDALIAFYEALSPTERVQLGIIDQGQLDNLIDKLRLARQASQQWGKVAGLAAGDVAQALSSAAANAFTNFIERVSNGKNVFKALGASVREFAADFIASIAQMIVQLLAFSAAVQVLRLLGVPIPASVGVHHAGGIAGSAGGAKRSVNPLIFAAATRYHTGGIVGLAPDEVPAVLKRQEEVLTTSDPRHRFNGGLDGGSSVAGPPSLKIVNAFSPDEAAEMMLRTRSGERAILNIISTNSRAVRAALGGR